MEGVRVWTPALGLLPSNLENIARNPVWKLQVTFQRRLE